MGRGPADDKREYTLIQEIEMRKLLAAGILFGLSSFVVAAEMAPKETLPMSKILETLHEQGYNVVLKVELEGDAFKAKVIDAKGKEVKIEIASETGKVNRSKAQPTNLTMVEAVKKVEEAGYKNIYKISTGHNEYEMKAYDKENKKVSLDVDSATGKINKEWF